MYFFFFFFNDTATTEIYTLSLHDALPISSALAVLPCWSASAMTRAAFSARAWATSSRAKSESACSFRSEEHTSELQSRLHLVCRLLLEKKKKAAAIENGLKLSKRNATRHD